LVLEYADKGELMKWNEKREVFYFMEKDKDKNLEYKKKIMKDICLGL